MKTILLLASDERLKTRLVEALADASVFVTDGDADALKTLRLIDIDVIIRDSSGPPGSLASFAADARQIVPNALIVAVGPSDEDRDAADLVLAIDFTRRELDAVLQHGIEKLEMMRELTRLRGAAAVRTPPPTNDSEAAWDGPALARVLSQLARIFAAGFDLPRVLEMFLDAISALVQPARMAVLLPDSAGDSYRVGAHRGLAPQIVQSVRLPARKGLARWLAVQGRPARLQDLADPDTARELSLLQGVVAIPLLAHGELVAILVVGQPVFGSSYGRLETETLFDIATHLATAIRDIALHQQVRQEKEFSERILAHMSSGVITIGRDQKVGTINRRAEEILDTTAQAVLHQDLRVLPSPLGDMLFDTLVSGRVVRRSEVHLALGKLCLEVSTYPVRADESTPLGAVLVFEDLTAQKELAAQKQQADQLQLLTRVVARIADEIKNPLVSINTFIELIDERYDDPDFRSRFSSVVGRDVRRLVQVFEKLTGLVSEGELNFTTVDARTVLDQFAADMEQGDDGLGKRAHFDVTRGPSPCMVKVDATKLRKALTYLVRYLAHNSPGDQAKVSLSIDRNEADAGEVRILVSSRTAAVEPERLHRLFDPVQMVQESLIDVGPAVSQRLVEALGGNLRFRQSRHDLVFLVTLPLVAA